MATFLESTDLIDVGHPVIQALAAEARAYSEGDRETAVWLHDIVRDRVAFGFPPAFYETRASTTLTLGRGYCQTKSTLLTALLRAAGIPARIHFVDLDAALLSGVIDPGTPYVDHSFVEVYLDGDWVATDSYIVDLPLATKARERLRTEGRSMGYGVHADGVSTWDGATASFSQFVAAASPESFTSRDDGVHSDVLAFHRDAPRAWNPRGLGLRLLGSLAFKTANRRCAELRTKAD